MRSSLHLPLFTFVVAATVGHASAYDFFDNYRDLTPSPEDGPPASRHASRNRNLLPAQICAIVGGYILAVFFWGVLLLTVGRRMRRKTENSPKTLELELVTRKASPHVMPMSPASAKSATSWFKKGFMPRKASDSAPQSPAVNSPAVNSPASFDPNVVNADRERAMDEMERLYAAVMVHDRKKSLPRVSEQEMDQVAAAAIRPQTARRPSAIDTVRVDRMQHSNPASPVHAIYPPGYAQGPPTAPLPHSMLRDVEQPPASPRSVLRDSERLPASPRSLLSKKSNASLTSANKAARFNLKKLRISAPMQRYPGGANSDDDARTPLSPRFYSPGAPPSPPVHVSSPHSPMDPDEALDLVQPLPRSTIPRSNPPSLPSATTARAVPDLNLQIPSPQNTRPVNKSSSAAPLPFRSYAYTSEQPLKSPDLRTTVLDRRLDKHALQTPRTGVPFTPYSPYMPFTPITPVTPHLVTKKERKDLRKHMGRKLQGGEDMVQSPKDMFGDAW